MKKSTLITWILVICLSPHANVFPLDSPQREAENIRIKRLIGLCKLWGAVKYFHPTLAYRADIDFDKALVDAIPKINAAKNNEEYRAALQSMLSVLDDPLTHLVAESTASTPSPDAVEKQFDFDMRASGVLVITVGNYFRLQGSVNAKKLRTLIDEVPKARAIVFDLRSTQAAGDYGNKLLNMSFSSLESLISKAPLLAPGQRWRIYHGFDNQSDSPSAFSSGFYTQSSGRIDPSSNARDIPCIFLMNKNSGWLTSTLTMQATGKGRIVFEGNAKDLQVAGTNNLEAGDGIVAQIRLTELIDEDGSSGDLQPDVTVPVHQSGSDVALEIALEQARTFQPSAVVRRKLPANIARIKDRVYAEMAYPTLEYRLLAAFRIWSVFNYFFPYKQLMDENWESVLEKSIPKFEAAKDQAAYGLAIAEMLSYTDDTHVGAFGPAVYTALGSTFPPIKVRLIEGEPVVTGFVNEAQRNVGGIEIGDVILKVDGEDAKARLAWYARYVAASTPQGKMHEAVKQLLKGKPGSTLTLIVRNRANREVEVKLQRKSEYQPPSNGNERSGEIIKLLPGNLGYADLDRLTVEMVDRMFETFKTTRAIIFDMRGYPNATAWRIAPRLALKEGAIAAFFERPLIGGNLDARLAESFYPTVSPSGSKWIYQGKTVMLIDERSISQSEHTGLYLKAANNTKFIGTQTAGVNGDITGFHVPGNIFITFTGQSVRFPDGKQLQRIGLTPDIKIEATIEGIRSNKDEVLERAIEYLKQELEH